MSRWHTWSVGPDSGVRSDSGGGGFLPSGVGLGEEMSLAGGAPSVAHEAVWGMCPEGTEAGAGGRGLGETLGVSKVTYPKEPLVAPESDRLTP